MLHYQTVRRCQVRWVFRTARSVSVRRTYCLERLPYRRGKQGEVAGWRVVEETSFPDLLIHLCLYTGSIDHRLGLSTLCGFDAISLRLPFRVMLVAVSSVYVIFNIQFNSIQFNSI